MEHTHTAHHETHTHHAASHGHHDHSHHIGMFRQRFYISLLLTLPILYLSPMIRQWIGLDPAVAFQGPLLFLFASVIYLYGGWPFLNGLAEELRIRTPGMMTLIAMAMSVAFFYSAFTLFVPFGKSFFWELATLIDIMLLGHWIEAKSVMGASGALEELIKIIPADAHRMDNGEIDDIPVSKLQAGDTVLVRPGEKIPSDGTVADGESHVDESLVTGESRPVVKKPGDPLIGGSVNKEGSLTVTITKTGSETYLAQVVEMVRSAQQKRSRTQDFANRAAAWLFYAATAAGAVTFAVWYGIAGADEALERTVTVLVIACPHALGLAIPLVVALSTSVSAKNGILIRDRRAFEEARSIDTVVFDKTGTLTKGSFGVSDTLLFQGDEATLLRITAAVESRSEHAIAAAIVAHVKAEGITPADSSDFKALPGKGAQAEVEGQRIHVGGPELLYEMDVTLDDPRIERVQSEGKSVVFTLQDGKPIGAFALADIVRDESEEAAKALHEMGIGLYLLTGDAKEVADAVAKQIGIDHVYAQLLPHQKAETVHSLRDTGRTVAMVGDGINDAPALAGADVGIAVGSGTDVTIESADIILVKDDPRDVARAIGLARRTYAKMVQNLWWAAGYNILAIPAAAGLLAPVGIVINPAMGAVLMSLSTVIVALNTQTLRNA